MVSPSIIQISAGLIGSAKVGVVRNNAAMLVRSSFFIRLAFPVAHLP